MNDENKIKEVNECIEKFEPLYLACCLSLLGLKILPRIKSKGVEKNGVYFNSVFNTDFDNKL